MLWPLATAPVFAHPVPVLRCTERTTSPAVNVCVLPPSHLSSPTRAATSWLIVLFAMTTQLAPGPPCSQRVNCEGAPAENFASATARLTSRRAPENSSTTQDAGIGS